MSANDQHQFSPFFKVRRILLFLRWPFGFPLKAKNIAFNEFVFQPCLEYTRYSLYICCFFLTGFYLSYLPIKENNIESLLEAKTKVMESHGYTLLDICVIYTIPYTTLMSSFFYFTSFKKAVTSISKVCSYLTSLNKELDLLEWLE